MKKKLYWLLYLCLWGAIFIWTLNYGLMKLYGFGNPIIYDDNPIYGYRPLPNQETFRRTGKRIKINNLGIRCNQDWDTITSNKILILSNSVSYGGSYIDNSELFSTLVTKKHTDLISGSAGVNAWGIMNIYGLIVLKGFQPADTYVTVLIEGDFYRGITRSTGYQWKRKPSSAIQEVFIHYLFNHVQQSVSGPISSSMNELIVENAVKYLKDMDSEFIRKKKGI